MTKRKRTKSRFSPKLSADIFEYQPRAVDVALALKLDLDPCQLRKW